MRQVIVASKNPVKIEAAKNGFTRMFNYGKFNFTGISVPSLVSDQPMSNKETLQGAINRVENASKAEPDADYWIGIEGGLDEGENGMETFAWIVVKDKEGKIGKGKTGSFFLPNEVAKLVKEGKELGDADDIVFGLKNSKQANGSVGILTGDVLTRTTFYEPAVILALIPFRNQSLY